MGLFDHMPKIRVCLDRQFVWPVFAKMFARARRRAPAAAAGATGTG